MMSPTHLLRLHAAPRRLASTLSRFARGEAGTMTIFGIYLAVLIMMIGGIAVDVMRSESVRTKVQNVEDTAVLAATNLNQSLDPTAVVKDYFAKADMTKYLKSVHVTSSATSRTVTAHATTTLPTFFMKLEGIDTLTTNNASTAVQSIGNVEISLALDNSGSMAQAITTSCSSKQYNNYGGWGNCTSESKIDALKTAASDFVDTMFNNSEPGTVTMSIIPYDSHVNIGPDLLKYLNVTQEQTKTKCVDFTAAAFDTPSISPTAPLQRTAFADEVHNTTNVTASRVDCNSASYRDSLVFSSSPSALKAEIGAMQAGGNTSIDSGVKWAAAALDPAWQPVVDRMIANGELASSYAGRPVSYNDNSNMKVLIVMSDGENTARYQLKPGYYSGPSHLFTNSDDPYNYSFYDPTRPQPYFWTVDDQWHNLPYAKNGGTYTRCSYWSCGTYTAQGTATELSYPQLWAKWSVPYFLNNVIAPAYGSYAANTWYNNIVDIEDQTSMDSHLHAICSAAKAKGVLIYSIGFQTSTHGAATLTDCASAPSYYFNAQGTEISDVFAKIATSIQHLRLTQ